MLQGPIAMIALPAVDRGLDQVCGAGPLHGWELDWCDESGGLTAMTEQRTSSRTDSAVLPMSRPLTPVRATVPMTNRLIRCLSTASATTSAARPL